MNNENDWNERDRFLLNECYELAERYESDEQARIIIRKKQKGISAPLDYTSTSEMISDQPTDMQLITEALLELSSEPLDSSRNAPFKYASQIAALPPSGDKEYLLALLELRNGTTETNRILAFRHITEALRFSNRDPRYVALAGILEEAGRGG